MNIHCRPSLSFGDGEWALLPNSWWTVFNGFVSSFLLESFQLFSKFPKCMSFWDREMAIAHVTKFFRWYMFASKFSKTFFWIFTSCFFACISKMFRTPLVVSELRDLFCWSATLELRQIDSGQLEFLLRVDIFTLPSTIHFVSNQFFKIKIIFKLVENSIW